MEFLIERGIKSCLIFVLVDNVSHSYRSIPQCLPVSFNDDQEEICKITHEVEYLPTYPYLEIKTT